MTASAVALALLGGCVSAGGDFPDVGLRAERADGAGVVMTDRGALALSEVFLRNEGEGSVTIERVTGSWGEVFEGDALLSRLVPRRRTPDRDQRTVLAPNAATVVLLTSPTGGATDWTFVVRGTNTHGVVVGSAVRVPARGAGSPAPVLVGPVLTGDRWLVENGPETTSGHRRAIIWRERRPCCAQRFAIDFFRVGADGRTSRGDGKRNEDHYAFGADVIACADAVVSAAEDAVPENTPDPSQRAVEMTHATLAGNHVVLDLGNGAFAMYAHLRAGSVKVRAGERVRRGDVIGALGNSGNATEPHLHFHVADGPSPVLAEGLPWAFEAFATELNRAVVQRSRELPAEGAVVSFSSPASLTSDATNSPTMGLPNADTNR